MNIESRHIYLIIFIILGIYLIYSPKENYKCIDDNYINLLLDQTKLDKKIYNIVFNSLNSSYYTDTVKIGDLLKDKNSEEKIKILNQIEKLMNNNRQHDIYNDYVINETSSLNVIRNAWIQDNILNKLICSTDRKQIEILNNYVISLLTASHLKMCSKDSLIKHCQMTLNNKIKKVSQKKNSETEKTVPLDNKLSDVKNIIKNKEIEKVIEKMTNFVNSKGGNNLIEGLSNITQNKFETNSLESVLKNINTNSFGDLEKPHLIKFINLYEKKYSKNFNFKANNDIVKLVIMVVPEAIKLAKEIKTISRSDPKKQSLVREFIPLRSLFYKLKHFYKQLSYYNIIDAYIKDPKDREIAMLCCQSIQDTNKCFNFSDKASDSEPIVMGFFKNEKESMGYIKETKCQLPGFRENFNLQQKSLREILESNKDYKYLDTKIKDDYLNDMIKYFKYFGITIGKSSNRLTNILDKIKLEDKEKFRKNHKILPKISKNKMNEVFDMNNKYINKLLNKINEQTNIDKLEEIIKLTGSEFDFRSLNNIEIVKQSMEYLVKLNHIFSSIGLPNKQANELIKKLFIIQKSITFEKIFDEYIIPRRLHKIIIKSIIDLFKKNKDILISNNLTPNSLLKNINFKKTIFPVEGDLNICNTWVDLLQLHRRTRALNIKEYVTVKNKIINLCSKRAGDFKEKQLENSDKNVIEKQIKKIDIKTSDNKKISIIVKEDKNKKTIMKKTDTGFKETNIVILKNNQVLKNNVKVNSDEILIDSADGNKINAKLKNSFIKISNEKNLDKVKDVVELGLFIVSASVKDIKGKDRIIKLYLRREKNFDQYIINEVYKSKDIIYKFTLDSKFNLFMYNNPYSKSVVTLLDQDKKNVIVNVIKGKLDNFQINKITQISTYKKYNSKIDNVLKNKLYHFFGSL
tara:strand:- start:5091 stop:7835 length:2745 start_codon:yes stop_codon:yes gene_type:complete